MHHDRDPEAINAETRPEIGYEYRDISVKGIVISTLWFFVGSTIVIALTYVGYWALLDLPIRPVQTNATIPAYPNPLLQGNVGVKAEIAEVKRQEWSEMNEYGWIDKQKGVARMPVEKALEDVAASGLKPAAPAGGTRL